MLRFIVRMIGTSVRFIFWDSDRKWQERKHGVHCPEFSSNPRGPVFTCKSGRIGGRVFLNHTSMGKPYTKAQFGTRGKDGKLTYSFFEKDLDDTKRCIDKAAAWMKDSRIA